MQQFLSSVLGIIISAGVILTGVVLGILYIAGIWKKGKDGEDDRLINILKETVDALEIKVNKQTDDIEQLTKKVDELEKENTTLIRVLQGRDDATLTFQQQMLDTIKISMETNGLAKETSTKLSQLIDVMSEHLKAVESRQATGN